MMTPSKDLLQQRDPAEYAYADSDEETADIQSLIGAGIVLIAIFCMQISLIYLITPARFRSIGTLITPTRIPRDTSDTRFEPLLFDYGLVQFGNFTLQSGKTSNTYFDLRAINSHPDLLRLAVQKWREDVDPSEFDTICGVATGGLAPASVLAWDLQKPYIYVRSAAGKGHGLGKQLEGHYRAGDRVLLIDDVLTTGGSLRKAAQCLEQAGLQVVGIAVLLDRRSLNPDLDQGLDRFDTWSLVSVTNIKKVLEARESQE